MPKRPPGETHKQRVRSYRHIKERTIWVGAGLLGLIGLLSAGVLDEAPWTLRALVVTFVVLGGAFLAQTRVRFEWRETIINRKIEDRPRVANMALSDDLKEFPR
jgi:hypothetical protein